MLNSSPGFDNAHTETRAASVLQCCQLVLSVLPRCLGDDMIAVTPAGEVKERSTLDDPGLLARADHERAGQEAEEES